MGALAADHGGEQSAAVGIPFGGWLATGAVVHRLARSAGVVQSAVESLCGGLHLVASGEQAEGEADGPAGWTGEWEVETEHELSRVRAGPGRGGASGQ